MLTDDETSRAQLEAGQVDVRIDCDGCSVEDGTVRIPFESLDPATSDTRRIHLSLGEASNPSRLWLRAECPPVVDPLGEALETRIAVERVGKDGDGATTDERTFPLGSEWMSFSDLRRELRDGIRLGDSIDPCLAPGAGLVLSLEYRLPEDTSWVAGTETDLHLEVFGQQCRHVSESDVGDGPFSAGVCPTLECSSCIRLGKIDVEGDRLHQGRTYGFDDLASPFDADGHEYAIEVLTVTDKVDEDERETVCASFRLLRDGSESAAPPMCSVRVGGGRPGGEQPGDGSAGREGDTKADARSVRYDFETSLTRTPGEVCAAHDKDDPAEETDAERPAISNLAVFVCEDTGEVSADA